MRGPTMTRRQFLKGTAAAGVGLGGALALGANLQPEGRVINIEGNPDSPINRGTLRPKGAASFQLTVKPLRARKALYRRPGGTEWETIELERAMEMIAERVKKTRDETWVEAVTLKDADGNDVNKRVNHTLGIFSLGGATMNNEWNYAQLKLMRGLGVVAIENQARI